MKKHPRRPGPPDDVAFPVTPMLDMAFQLLAFFILTFQAPSRETRIDLYLPAKPATMPSGPGGEARPAAANRADLDLDSDVSIRAEADDAGRLKSLRLGEAALSGADELADRLRRYQALLEGRSLRVLLIADDRLLYEEAARLVGTCAAIGVSAVRLLDPIGDRVGKLEEGRP